MCCFAQPVQRVAHTRLFARREEDRQYLVYQMAFQSAEPNAMILPLPVALPATGETVRFISLKDCPTFFDDLAELFRPEVVTRTLSRSAVDVHPQSYLPVENVGDFVASWVPTMDDFARLDPRFIIRKDVWNRVPVYADYGFVVFQLDAPPESLATVHPMAFTFRTRLTSELFFPTVHIHDGQVHAREEFDHQLYWQGQQRTGWWERARNMLTPGYHVSRRDIVEMAEGELPTMTDFAESVDGGAHRHPTKARALARLGNAGGIFAPGHAVHRLALDGYRRNADTFV